MNKKGVSLIELLGAIVIFGIMMGMIATILSLFNTYSDSITLRSQANHEGLLIGRTIKDELLAFNATDYSPCGVNCIIFENHFEHRYDPNTDLISPFLHTPVLTHRIEIVNNVLLVNGISVLIPGFTLGPNSKVSITPNPEVPEVVNVIIVIELVANDTDSFLFTTSYSFEVLPIPII